jgi:hypothetical protein
VPLKTVERLEEIDYGVIRTAKSGENSSTRRDQAGGRFDEYQLVFRLHALDSLITLSGAAVPLAVGSRSRCGHERNSREKQPSSRARVARTSICGKNSTRFALGWLRAGAFGLVLKRQSQCMKMLAKIDQHPPEIVRLNAQRL